MRGGGGYDISKLDSVYHVTLVNTNLGLAKINLVSRDFGTLFFIPLDRFEGHNMARSGLFFILMTFSCINFKKIMFRR
jgi:hypothetical protein